MYLGLAGLIIVEDETDLGLPDHFGVDDLPLIIQDRVIDETDGSIGYDLGELDVVYGVRGDTVIVNGAITPMARVPAGWVRLRLLNGSNARNFELRFQDGRTFYVIASDGGFLSRPVPMSVLRISPAERFESLVDFSDGQPVVLETGPDRAIGLFGAISDEGHRRIRSCHAFRGWFFIRSSNAAAIQARRIRADFSNWGGICP